jgi:hypothetical protein
MWKNNSHFVQTDEFNFNAKDFTFILEYYQMSEWKNIRDEEDIKSGGERAR